MAENKEKLIEDYKKQRPLYEDFTDRIEELLKNLLKECKLSVHSISSRTKSIEKYSGKISRQGKDYGSFTDITDLSAVRVICLFAHQVDKVSEIIEKNFSVDKKRSVDKRKDIEPDRFGYLSLHYVVKLSSERVKLKEYERYKDLFCEIQIRSILQHAWAEIEHDLGYKTDIELPRHLRRRFCGLAALLEMADEQFDGLVEEIQKYKDMVEEKIKTAPKELLLDRVSLEQYITSSQQVVKTDKAITDSLGIKFSTSLLDPLVDINLKILQYLNVRTIEELDRSLSKNAPQIIEFTKEFITLRAVPSGLPEKMFLGFCILYLGFYLAAEKLSENEFSQYLGDVGVMQEVLPVIKQAYFKVKKN